MTLSVLLLAVAIVGGVGLFFGSAIAMANKKLKVWEDPRIDEVNTMLPGANCGGCGFAGCRAFAEAVVSGTAKPAGCNVAAEEARQAIAAYLGVDAGQATRIVARLLCAGGSDVAPRKAEYVGLQSCAAAVAVGGGGKGCTWGCVGLADCGVACTFDAIELNERGLPVVDLEKCTACGDCVKACPLGLFTLLPADNHLLVQCRSLLQGEAATALCSVACNACGRCAVDAAPGLIAITNGLAVIDYGRIELENRAATARCPTGAITWLEGQQFALPAKQDSGALVAA